MQSLPVAQTPPKQPSEQQSWALLHATPSARQASRHSMTPACPVTGSHRPLQQSAATLHAFAGAPHESGPPPEPAPPSALPPRVLPTHTLFVHVPEQQSKPFTQGAASVLHA